MKLLNKNNIIKNQVNTIEQYKVLNYLKDTFNTDAIAIYLIDRYTIKVIDTNNDIGYFKYNSKTKNSRKEVSRFIPIIKLKCRCYQS